jgi:ferredoxin-type protein NapF
MRPPWSLRPDERFTAACTRCGDCVQTCPEQVLVTGDRGFPEIRFTQNGCTLCGDCARACPSGAIRRDPEPEAFAWRVRIGAACLTLHGVECRICGDACDTRALRFVPALGGIAQLRVDFDACTGCGACAPVCPVDAVSFETGKTGET